MALKTSAAGRTAITRHEGLRLNAYPDPASGGEPWTIGVGHTSSAGAPKVTKGMKITKAQADEILSRDLVTFEKAVNDAVKVPVNQNEFDALVSLAFNIGAGAFKKSSLVKRLNEGKRQAAADQFLSWTKAAGKTMPGLVNRRNDERKMFLTPVKVAATPAAVATIPVPAAPVAIAPKPAPKPEPPLFKSKRFLTWLGVGGSGGSILGGVAGLDIWLQRGVGILLILLALYAVATMPQVRKALGLSS